MKNETGTQNSNSPSTTTLPSPGVSDAAETIEKGLVKKRKEAMEEKISKSIKSKQEAAAVNTVAASFKDGVTRVVANSRLQAESSSNSTVVQDQAVIDPQGDTLGLDDIDLNINNEEIPQNTSGNIIAPQEKQVVASFFSEIGKKFNEMGKDLGNPWNLLSNTIALKEKVNFTDITEGMSGAAQQTSKKVNEKDSKLTSDQKNQVSKINDYISKEALIAGLKQVAQTLGMQKEDGQEQNKGEQRQNKSQTFRDKIFSNMVTNITGYFNAIMTPNEKTKPEVLETEQKDRMAEDIKVVGDQLDVAGTKLQGGPEVLKGYFNDAFTSVNNSSTISATQAKDLIAKAFKQIQSLAANSPDLKTIIDPIKNNIKYFTGGYERERDETHKKKTKEESRVTEDTEKNVQQEQDSNTRKEPETPLNTIDTVKKTPNSDLDKKDLPEDNIKSALLSNNEEEVKNQRTNHDTLPNSIPNLSKITPELISKLNNQEGLNQTPQKNQGPDGFDLGYRLGKLEQKVDEMRPPEASEKPGMSNGMKAALAIGFFILLLINPAFAFIAATVVGAGVIASSSGFGQLTNGNKEQSRQSGKENEKSGILQRFFKSREREKEGPNDIESSTSPKPENTKIAHSTAPKAPYTMKVDSTSQGQERI